MFYARDPRTQEQIPDDELRALAGAMASARRNAEQLRDLATAIQADRTRTPEASALELRRSALSLGEKGARTLDAARQRASEVLKRIEAETTAPPPPRDAMALQIEAEVRTRLAGMQASERRVLIEAAIQGGNDTIVGAALRGPAMLIGMDQTEHDLMRLRWREARHPEKAAKIERIVNALEAVDRGGNLLMSFVERVSNSSSAQRAQAQANATDTALQAIQAAE